jgi:hypothetical protein
MNANALSRSKNKHRAPAIQPWQNRKGYESELRSISSHGLFGKTRTNRESFMWD